MSKAKYTTAEVLKKLLVSDDEHDSSNGDDDGSEVSDLEESSDSSSAENESDMDTLESTSTLSSVKTDLLTILQWKSNCANAPVAPVFSAKTGVLIDTVDFTPLDYFMTYIDTDLIRHFVIQTNLYAAQYLRDNDHKLGPNSRARRWKDTDQNEIMKFIGLTLLMGVVKKPLIAMYWSEDAVLCTPIFAAVMKRNRYQLLLRFFHFNDNDKSPASDAVDVDRLYKIRPVIDHLFEKFQSVYGVDREISIDESLLLWKGRLLFKQYLPLKRSRFGIKLYKLCESNTGYVFRYYIYVGKDCSFNIPTSVPADFGATEKIVWYLIL